MAVFNCTVQTIAQYVSEQADTLVGQRGYSSIGVVVGATYPEEAVSVRKLMPKSYCLVPGYGVQGGGAKDILPCFNADGLGAIVNSSRGILYTYSTNYVLEENGLAPIFLLRCIL